MPVWHASVARLGKGRTLWFSELTDDQIARAVRTASGLLKGVGDRSQEKRFRTQQESQAVHLQRPLTDDEILLLPDGWMAIPAMDEVGPYEEF